MSEDQSFIDILEASRSGDTAAWSQLVKLIYADLRRIAHLNIGNRQYDLTLNTTALVSECYIRLVGTAQASVNSRSHFMNLASRVMRQVLCDYARERLATKRGGDQRKELPEALDNHASMGAFDLVELDMLLKQLEAEHPQAAKVFECRYFAGLTDDDTGAALGIGTRTAQRLWQTARTWLAERIA